MVSNSPPNIGGVKGGITEDKGELYSTEFSILLDWPREEIAKISDPMIAESVVRIREGKVHVEGGYDGVFGKIHIYSDEERAKLFKAAKQVELF